MVVAWMKHGRRGNDNSDDNQMNLKDTAITSRIMNGLKRIKFKCLCVIFV